VCTSMLLFLQRESLLPRSFFCAPRRDNEYSANVISSGSDTHHVNFFNINGSYLNTIEPSTNFLHTRSTPISATAFHPHHMMLACSSLNDQHINLYACEDRRPNISRPLDFPIGQFA
jgi:hypothetical protein